MAVTTMSSGFVPVHRTLHQIMVLLFGIMLEQVHLMWFKKCNVLSTFEHIKHHKFGTKNEEKRAYKLKEQLTAG